ncbi:MAG: tetratricopeptide repeat protein [Anaerolineae bacterium]|nr:tetratricopeptide repeat protein [Anaerolineae bacterium]
MTNPQEFDKLMESGAGAGWDGRWQDAVEAFSQAVKIKPDDADANNNLALALFNTGELDNSLKFYKRAHQLAPNDPEPLERSADVLERMGKNKEAAGNYVKVSDAYLKQRNLNKAIENWERATYLNPGMVSVHARMAQAYERVGNKGKTIREYLTMAYHFQKMKEDQRAVRAVNRALRLDKTNAQALNFLRSLQSGRALPDDIIKREPPSKRDLLDDPAASHDDDRRNVGEAHPLGPIGEALDEAMELLAQYVVESGLNEYVMHAMQGMTCQRQGDNQEAAAAYAQADEAGLQHPSLKLALGGLLVLNEQAAEAIPHLEQAIPNETLLPGALHGLGLSYFKLGKHKDASRYLIQSLRAVDTNLTEKPKEQEDLSKVYDSLLSALDGRSPEVLKTINERFIGMLSGKDWKQSIAETRRHLDETLRDEGGQGVVDILVARGGDDLADMVTGVDRYIRNGLYTLAMDEAHRAVEKSPYYLPIHVRMAEVMMKEGRIRQAINKYNMVAKSYLVREENDRAAAILYEVLEMAPLDTDVRVNLIHLLEGEKRLDEALDQYIDLAETFQQLGDFEHASQTFEAAGKMAAEINASADKVVQIKHYIADINQMRLNTREAQRIYEEILTVKADDEKALRSLIDIYFTQDNRVEAVKRLDVLLGLYAKAGDVKKIEGLLSDLVLTNPNDTALRQRLASIYRRLNRTREAIEQLDALGELQLDAGLTQEACQTIKQIVTLGPENLDDYKRLLQQLGC